MTPPSPKSWTRAYRRRVMRLSRELHDKLMNMAYWETKGWPAHINRSSYEKSLPRIAEAARQAAVQAALGHPARVDA